VAAIITQVVMPKKGKLCLAENSCFVTISIRCRRGRGDRLMHFSRLMTTDLRE
jgi:hypothetical protein